MTIVGKCVYCGWLVAADGTYEPAASERPEGAREHRCDDSACVVASDRITRIEIEGYGAACGSWATLESALDAARAAGIDVDADEIGWARVGNCLIVREREEHALYLAGVNVRDVVRALAGEHG